MFLLIITPCQVETTANWLVFADVSQTVLLPTTDSFDLPTKAGQVVEVTAVVDNIVK